MRRVKLTEIESEFEHQFCWGDDERYLYNPRHKKASVFGHFLRINEVLRLIDKYSLGPRVVDLACAQGNFGLLLAEKGYDVTAVDIKPEFLKYALKKYTHGKFRTQEANLMEFRSPEPFDCALAGEIIEHVAQPERLLEAAAANLKPGGILVLTTPNGNEKSGSSLPTYSQVTDIEELIPRQFHWGEHLFLYTLEELGKLFDLTGLDVVYQEKYHSSYVSQIRGFRYLFPLGFIQWMERKSRHWKRKAKDSANFLIVVGAKRKD